MFTCKRCGYETQFKENMKKHFTRKNPCKSVLHDAPIENLLAELQDQREARGQYACTECGKEFAHATSMYRHRKCCVKKDGHKDVQALQDALARQQQQIEELSQKTMFFMELAKQRDRLMMDLNLARTHKNEIFYQKLVEHYLGGTHKRMQCGVTDVTTDTCHAEVKRWESYKEAIGQLLCYNNEEPRQELHVYLFGKYEKKKEVVDILLSLNMRPFTFVIQDDRAHIIRLPAEEVVWEYTPTPT